MVPSLPTEDEKELLPAGLHEFPYAFNLPPNLPPSFHSDKGFIVYTAIAILDRPAAANLVQKAGFSLHSILDLNMFSQASVSDGPPILCTLPIENVLKNTNPLHKLSILGQVIKHKK